MNAILDIDISSGPVIVAAYVLSAAAFVYLLLKKLTLRWVVIAADAVIGGALLGLAVLWLFVDVLDVFGGPVNDATWVWVPACFAGIVLAIANLWGARWGRIVIAAVSIVVFAITATLGVNAAYGITPTLGDFLHINTDEPIEVIRPTATPTPDAGPLVASWSAPDGMPSKGRVGVIDPPIPATVSGFHARPAEIYYPPAALVKDPPLLPVVVMMMGQPGDPDAKWIASTLDSYAAGNKGLAPIAVVIDQLGSPSSNPLCLDSPLGNVESYVMDDVVPWIASNLVVSSDRRDWTVAGYSNGGECASYFGSKYPDVFGNILSISGEEFEGSENTGAVLRDTFNGDQAAYDAVKPASIMAGTTYPDSFAVFTVGSGDSFFMPAARTLAADAKAAGMTSQYVEIAGADHGATGLQGGLDSGFALLYPRLGLSEGPLR